MMREGEPLTTQFFAIIETGKEPVRVALVQNCFLLGCPES